MIHSPQALLVPDMMSIQCSCPSPFLCAFCFLILVLVNIQLSLSNAEMFEACRRQFRCGNITAGYPFWGGEGETYGRPDYCGHNYLKLYCKDDTTMMMINDVEYRVFNINETAHVLKIARQDYLIGLCSPDKLVSTTIDSTLFEYSTQYKNFTLCYGVPHDQITCSIDEMKMNFIYADGLITNLKDSGTTFSVTFPIHESFLQEAKRNLSSLEEALKQGFEVKWKVNGTEICEKCFRSHGFCIPYQTTCYCLPPLVQHEGACLPSPTGQPPKGPPETPDGEKKKARTPTGVIGVAVAIGVVAIFLVCCCIFIVLRRRKNVAQYKSRDLQTLPSENDKIIGAFVRNYRSLAPQRYSYSDVKKMTKSFSNKLGQGSYGNVYKGKLPDGRLAAVKVMKESRGNGEGFMNEVASISRTSHVNIVTFLGFCYERKKRALIFEFMPNGSLDKFIYDQEPSSTTYKLEWKTMFEIAVGIARGLEYLHRRCNIRIVHFDIKPHNILLDDDFCPKISDFGLAKQSKKKESIISILHARGTIGYIAPEVFCRNFGGVSHKSDVYSYGMMILEMVGARKNIDVRVSLSQNSEIYFPDPIYRHLESGNDINLEGVVTEEEQDMAKKMILVSLWCIQTNPSDRPSTTKILEMLEGSLQNLPFPPKPFLFSPTRSHTSSATQVASDEESSIS